MFVMAIPGATLGELESLYRAELPRFVRVAAAIIGDEGAGRDVVQEAFAQAVKKLASFKGGAPLEAWVWRIVINEALMLRRRDEGRLAQETELATSPSSNHRPETRRATPRVRRRCGTASAPTDRLRHGGLA